MQVPDEMAVRVHSRILSQRYSNPGPWLQTGGNDASEWLCITCCCCCRRSAFTVNRLSLAKAHHSEAITGKAFPTRHLRCCLTKQCPSLTEIEFIPAHIPAIRSSAEIGTESRKRISGWQGIFPCSSISAERRLWLSVRNLTSRRSCAFSQGCPAS